MANTFQIEHKINFKNGTADIYCNSVDQSNNYEKRVMVIYNKDVGHFDFGQCYDTHKPYVCDRMTQVVENIQVSQEEHLRIARFTNALKRKVIDIKIMPVRKEIVKEARIILALVENNCIFLAQIKFGSNITYSKVFVRKIALSD